MDTLTFRERELVALGAALGSNCIPCIEYHVPEARKAGLTDPQIREAIQLADNVRQTPARKALDAAFGMVSKKAADKDAERRIDGDQSSAAGSHGRRCCG